MMRRFHLPASGLAAILAAFCLYLSALAAASADGRAMVLPVDPVPLIAETDEGDRTLTIEVADEPREHAAGLMYRQDMADNHGMLFDLGETRRATFWMKNTPMPLDLVFIGEDGRVIAVLDGVPFSTAPVGPEAPSRFVLELKAGIAQKAGIAVGDRLRHPVIDRVAGEG